jgi:3-oxoacyl-[acyl-carrier protein] reductase
MDYGSRVALVTGGSRGIGAAVVAQFATDGFDVAFCYQRESEQSRRTERAVCDLGRAVYAAECDVTDLAAVRQFVKETERTLGDIEVVVNSAGIVRDNPLVMMDEIEWSAVLRTNLDGTFNICRTVCFEFMKRRTGCVINISSVACVYGNSSQTNYAASKAGIIGFTRSLAKEVGRYGIRVNAVAPGMIETDMTKGLSESTRKSIMTKIPLKRFGVAEDVGHLVSFLASARANYITGQVLHVDGGIVL